jgi:hypothetical protein
LEIGDWRLEIGDGRGRDVGAGAMEEIEDLGLLILDGGQGSSAQSVRRWGGFGFILESAVQLEYRPYFYHGLTDLDGFHGKI